MKLLPDPMPSGAPVASASRKVAAAALLFLVTTFAISSFRASLNPDTVFELFHPKRIILIVAGAGLFWLAIRTTDGRRPSLAMARRLAMIGLPGLATLFALAAAWDLLVTGETADLAARNLRWILLWSGYFGTGIAAWLALQYHAALARLERQSQDTGHGLAASANEKRGDNGFWVKTGRQTIRIAQADVEWIEAEGNYVRIHASGGSGLIRSTLAAIESQLETEDFIRIHRSALCRRSAIRGYRRKPTGSLLALLASGAEAPIGRSFARHLIAQLRPLTGNAFGSDDTVSQGQGDIRAA